MGESDDSARSDAEQGRRFRVETVRGDAYEVGGRRLTPVARITSFGKAKATIGARQVSGWGGGFVQVTPLAIVEETPEGERQIAIADRTSQAVRDLILGTVAIVLVLGLIRWLAGRRGAGTHGSEGTGE